MKTCLGCKHANWKRTKAGRLHPSGKGDCMYQVKMPVLPACMYWLTYRPIKAGGSIYRGEEFKDHCLCYERAT
jgi:hypothetical protein